MSRFVFLLVAAGLVLCYLGYQEQQLANKCDVVPQSLSVKDLIANGPGGNCNVSVTDYAALSTIEIITQKRRGPDTSEFYTPLIPITEAALIANQDESTIPYQLIVKTDDANSLDIFAEVTSLQGLIVNDVESLGGQEANLIRQHLPGSNPKSCYILDLNRQPASTAYTYSMLGGGALLSLLGLLLGVGSLTSDT